MKKLVLMMLALISLQTFGQKTDIKTDANAVQRTLNGSFTAIHISGGIDVVITQAEAESVAVSASEDKYLERIKTEVVNGILKIYYDTKAVNIKTGIKKLKAYVSFKNISALKISGGSNVKINGDISTDKLHMEVKGGSNLKGKAIVKNLQVEVNSGAYMKLDGSSDNFMIEAGSGGSFKGYDFITDYCDASLNSGAGAEVTINKELRVKASSGAQIKYKGDAAIKEINTNSGGSVKKQ